LIETTLSLQSGTMLPLLPDLLFAAFVIFAEGWIWIERALTRINIKMIDTLDDYYALNCSEAKSKALEAHWRIPDNLAWWKTIRRKMKQSSKV
jgi:hypothetical protein